ncbi:MAG: aspartyl protease family protein [Verrucomicrobiota bacterium]
MILPTFKTFLASLPCLLLGIPALAGSTSFPFAYEQRVPFVQVQPANPTQPPLCFILDTGALTTVVDWTTIGSLDLGLYKMARPGRDFATATTCGMGNAPAGFIQGIRATCGGFPLKNTAIRTDLSNMSQSSGHRVDGLLGTDFLRDKILTLSFATHSWRLERAPGTDNFFTRMINSLPFDRCDAVFVKITTPMLKRPLTFLVDTGASHCVIDSAVAKRLQLSPGAPFRINVIGGQKAASTANHFVGSWEGHPLPSQINTSDLSKDPWLRSHHIDGILGMDFMENYTVKMDFHTCQMQLLPNQTPLP